MKINTLFFLIFLSIICLAQKEKTNEIQDTTDSAKAAIDINNIWLPLDNRGVLGDVPLGDSLIANGMYDDEVFLFSGGFYLSGYSSGDMWGNGIARTDRIEDYQPGLVGSSPDSSINLVYQIRSTDPPFGSTWQAWKDAVSLGAKFYDGNEDGVYNPIDLNSNGLWDVNEDKPDFQGDQTAWCVYNDGVTRENRIYDVGSQGIEIRQSVFASDGHGNMFDDIIFIRYEVTNTGSAADILDSVYFAAMADADLGDYLDDLASVDTVEQSGIAYNSGEDDDFGINPPAFFVKQLQGPPVFIPGETFIDNDSDGEFTSGIDTPLDSAVAKHGKYLGEYYIAGAINNPITAFTVYHGLPNYDHPNNPQALRNYLIGGLNTIGEPLDPCTWFVGNGSTLPNCNSINPRFMYSGDPVSGNGWMNIAPLDNIFVLSTGPFKLKIGEPVELIYAYIVGRGTDHLNSITKAREISQFVQMVYDNNFENLPTGIDDDKNLIADEFRLYQNYPNPFNPVTTIKYQIPSNVKGQMANVKIIVFDILGREIKTLLNEQKPAGTYEVQFDASQLSSGVYFYQLSTGSLSASSGKGFIQTKKLMVLK